MGETQNYVEQVRSVLAELLPKCPPALLDLYTLLAMEFGPETDAVMVHNAWSIWCNRDDPTHRSLIPFPCLAPEVQALDEPYVKAIHQAVQTHHDRAAGRPWPQDRATDVTYEIVDHGPVKPPYGTPERAAWDAEHDGGTDG